MGSPSVDDFLPVIEAQRGDRYVLGAETRFSDPDPDEFDCSELMEWAVAGRLGIPFPDGAANQFRWCQSHRTLIPVTEAIATFGALLFRIVPHGGGGGGDHVVASLGNGRTFEARGRAYGVNEFSALGRTWTAGARIPGLDYTRRTRASAPTPPGRLRTTMDARDVLIHDAVGRAEQLLAKVLLADGVTPVLSPNTGTADGLQATQEMVARVESDAAILARRRGIPT